MQWYGYTQLVASLQISITNTVYGEVECGRDVNEIQAMCNNRVFNGEKRYNHYIITQLPIR